MELKVVCDCGQKFKFDVEPANGEMPFTVNCPSCGVDRTAEANVLLLQTAPAAEPVVASSGGRLQLNRVGMEAPPAPVTPTRVAVPRIIVPAVAQKSAATRSPGEFNLGLGTLGAFLGAGLGVGVMYGFFALVGFRFPLLGVGIGALTGYGARLLYKGTDSVLGFISAGIALVAVVGTLYLMYGEFPIISIISVLVSVSVAWQLASG
jgi:hypothetical protein